MPIHRERTTMKQASASASARAATMRYGGGNLTRRRDQEQVERRARRKEIISAMDTTPNGTDYIHGHIMLELLSPNLVCCCCSSCTHVIACARTVIRLSGHVI